MAIDWWPRMDGGAVVSFIIDLVNPGGRRESDLICVGATITTGLLWRK